MMLPKADPAPGLDLGGIFIPAVTPFDPVSGELDVVALRSNVRRWIRAPIRGIVIGGSTGEAVLLTPEERTQAVGAARELIPGDRLLLAGTGAESTRGTIRLTRDARGAGADAVLVQPPAFYREAMDRVALAAHYRAVADASPIPVVLYQVPLRFSTVAFQAGLVAELSEHPNVIGIKDSRGDLDALAEILTQCPRGFQVLVGEAGKLYASLETGAVGGILAIANLMPVEVCALKRAFSDGRSAEAGRLQEKIGPIAKEVLGGYGVPGIKVALDLIGLRGGAPRAPLRPVDDRATIRIRDTLTAAGLIPGSQQP